MSREVPIFGSSHLPNSNSTQNRAQPAFATSINSLVSGWLNNPVLVSAVHAHPKSATPLLVCSSPGSDGHGISCWNPKLCRDRDSGSVIQNSQSASESTHLANRAKALLCTWRLRPAMAPAAYHAKSTNLASLSALGVTKLCEVSANHSGGTRASYLLSFARRRR